MRSDRSEGGPRYRRALECLLGIPATEGNLVEVLRNGDEAFAAMLAAIDRARATVDLQTYGPWSGQIGERFAEALCARARDGVRVRVLLDALGRRHVDERLVGRMAAAGAQVERFRPLSNWRVTQSTHRGHRRVLICDGGVALTGGIGMADRWQGDARNRSEWRDTVLRVRGQAVNGLRGGFVDNWAETDQPLFDESVDPLPVRSRAGASRVQVVRGQSETGWGDRSTLVRALIGLARHRLRITADFFVPDGFAARALAEAVARGVTVELLRPGQHADSRSSQLASRAHYEQLLEAGVGIWAFQPSMLNVKVVTVDGEVACVGPLSFNARSLTFDDEICLVVFDRRVVAVLDAHFDTDRSRAEAVDLDRWRRRGRLERVPSRALGFLARHV